MKKQLLYLCLLVLLIVLHSCGVSKSIHHKPEVEGYNNAVPVIKRQSDTVSFSNQNSLLKNDQNLWELYVKGDPLERGLAIGGLSDTLLYKQEGLFYARINEWMPSKSRQRFLRTFIKFYNRKLYLNVPEEYKTEIYGISRYLSHDYDRVAPPYLRCLYLHGVHDIGHALQDLALVGCTSFAAWGDKTEDGSLLLGRNFDFYAGEGFAKNKIVAFVDPAKGYPFMIVTWPGMIGAVSGMNNEGLTVTINAGKSKIPLIARTPISILTREILQYAKNIDEAVAIARKRKVFVSESIMVGSANDKRAMLIEVTPKGIGLYEVTNSNQLICTNHFQSKEQKNNRRNKYQVKNSHSKYRYERMEQLLQQTTQLNPTRAAAILRDKDGLNNKPLGYGNEKAINQLVAHHGVIFKPEQRLVWVSANPYQLGEFVCYDLNKVFKHRNFNDSIVTLQETALNIPADPFAATQAYKNYEQFRVEDKKMDACLENNTGMDSAFAQKYQSLNPEYWGVYYKVGLYFYRHKEYKAAGEQFKMALTKEITTLPEKQNVEKYLKKANRK